jgi:predicted RNA-binding protein with PIN domain
MQKTIMIIDGYNVIHKIPAWEAKLDSDLQGARQCLMSYCATWMATRKDIWLFYVVFDGSSDVIGHQGQPARGVRPIFTQSGETADSRIIDIVKERKEDCKSVVVSEDREVIGHAKYHGAKAMNVSEFYRVARGKRGGTSGSDVGDKTGLTPAEQKRINDDLKELWGDE